MRLSTKIELLDNVYRAEVGIDKLTPLEAEAISRFDEPSIDVGSTIAGSATRPGDEAPTAVSFVLPAKARALPRQFPVSEVFSREDFGDADVRAAVWIGVVSSRVVSARNAALSASAPFISDNINTV